MKTPTPTATEPNTSDRMAPAVPSQREINLREADGIIAELELRAGVRAGRPVKNIGETIRRMHELSALIARKRADAKP